MSEIITTNDNIKYKIIDRNDLISKIIECNGDYEPELKHITQHFLNEKPGTLIDIGANIGTYCIPIAKKNPNTNIIAFEVQSKIYAQLMENIDINEIKNIKVYNNGLSDKVETLVATIPDYEIETNIGAFSLDDEVRQNDYEISTTSGTETFSLLTLDSFKFDNISLIKIDVEGMELKVLQGAQDTLEKNNYPPIIFEAWTWKPYYQTRRKELYDYLTQIGYNIIIFGENNLAQHKSNPNQVTLTLNQ
jgi:hypothetical protein